MILQENLLDYIKTESEKLQAVTEAIARGGRTWDECEHYIVSVLYEQVKDNRISGNGCKFACPNGRDEELVEIAIHYWTDETLIWEDVLKNPTIKVAGPSAKEPELPTLFDGIDDDAVKPQKAVKMKANTQRKAVKKVNTNNPTQLTLF